MKPIIYISIFYFFNSILFAQNPWSVEVSGGGGARVMDLNRNAADQSIKSSMYMQDVFIQGCYYFKDSHRFSVYLGHLLMRENAQIGANSLVEYNNGSVIHSSTLDHLFTLGFGYRYNFSKSKTSRFFAQGLMELGHFYGQSYRGEVRENGKVVSEGYTPFEKNPNGIQFDKLNFRSGLFLGYSILLSSRKKMNTYSLFLNTSAGMMYVSNSFPPRSMIGSAGMIGLELCFGKRKP
ncbi:MAG: hypothetical protein JJU02_10665 [Cryomorphaceae bacterium]|nr:hypothetical protein [Cryomorphaceae bacterium]